MSSPVIASSSSFSSSTGRRPRKRKHHVFLSFRGEDTRMGFTGHLYDALTSKGINTFMDDKKLRAGDLISPELLEAIAESRFGIVVLSRDYATSTWCLEELAYIVDFMEKMELIVIPVFYHVDPSDVRYQRKTFGEAFAKHETSNRVAPDKVKTWRAALRKVGDISGSHVQGTRSESEEIRKIVRRISEDLQDTLPRDATRGLVGIESRVEELKSLLDTESNDVRFIGICGMSGMGKTTLAEVVYEGIRNQFQGCSFIENIKDISKKNDSDFCKLQQKLLVDILKDEHICVRSVNEGAIMLQERLCERKIIIVLDDVNHSDQLEFLAREREWFGPGSRIIMTSTNEHLLTVHRVDGRYKCEGLKLPDAIRLFNLKAFAGQPKHGYEKLSSAIVKLADGLPLALNAFGSLLFGKGEEYWRETLVMLQQFPRKEVLERLEICYHRLERHEQKIFIYIACFLKGRNQELVNDILKNIGLCPVAGIDILIDRSLITINYDDSVWMHDLLQQMAWEVLCKEFPRQPGKRVALKRCEDVVDICRSIEKGTNAIKIINQEQDGAEVENCIGDHESFSKMKKLEFLRISNVDFPDGLEHLSNDLLILEWYGCSLKSFPQTFGPKRLYELDMHSSRLEKLWEKYIDLPNLRSINLCDSKHLTKIPDLTSTPKLWKLNLEGCTNLVELHKSLLGHKRLRYVNLKGCGKLRSLGNNMEMDHLEALLLSGCSKLEHIPEFGENMKRLEDLYLDGTKIKRLPKSLGKMRSLRKLDASETAIKELPSFILHLERLRLLRIHGCRPLSLTRTFPSMELASFGLKELDLSDCNLSVIPDGIGLLYSLKELNLSENDFVMLPASIRHLSNLRMLCLNSCTRLESLPLLSKINEVTLYGGEIRFSHYISGKGLDVSKFCLSSHDDNPSVSCLNCPKLIENQSGSGLADTILKKYIQVRTERRVIPEAIFEIVAARSENPWWFKLKGSDIYGIWDVIDVNFDRCIGVALCAVIVVPHSLDNMRGGAHIHVAGKYEIVAHIHVAGKAWRIPVPINFLEAELETQLVWYWPVTDDRPAGYQYQISFFVEPEDGNLEIKDVGVRFLCQEEILLLREPRFSITGIPSIMKIKSSLHRVFLSFRGEDTRMGFTGHLYDALTRQGINTFMDDENLRVGDLIRPKLLEAIAASRFGIVVLSSGYATSTCCLEELAYIVDCMEKMELIVIPVFYHLDPSHVQYQRNTFEQAFAKHETSNRVVPEKVKIWRAALRKVSDISGLHVQGTRYESEVISEIVRRISKDLQDTLPRDATKGLVGIESRVEKLKSLLDMESKNVRFIGICGMSGMGKTTLAEVVYEGICNQFQGYSFIGSIKDISRENDNDFCELQQKLLVDILKDEHIHVRSVSEGVRMLRERLRHLKIIIVLDDVNHYEELYFLVREREWFGLGSRIIMTTTNEDLLTKHGVDGRYKCEGLNFFDATRLFNLSAFEKEQPDPGYEKLSIDIVELVGGLPLALDAFGSLLYSKGEEYWRETLVMLQQFPRKEVLQRLEICYDRLEGNEREIFIYIACFLKGRDKELVKDILKNIGKHPVSGIDILKNRSLITINHDGSVWMHDLLQQMGWEVLCKKFPTQPGKRVGLKCLEDIVDICTSKEKGTNAIEIINQEHYRAEVENYIGDRESFSKMKKLRFLRISNVVFPDGLEHLSNDLRVLEWYRCSLKCFPQKFGPEQIYELDMRFSQLEKLWEKDIDLPNLRSINLCDSKHLTKIPDLTSTPKLWKLNLEGCTNLVELHKSLLGHKRLRYVNLKGCGKLRSLGNNMEMDHLEALLLSGCSKLEHIPEFGENMKRLEDLYLDGTKIKRLPESLGKMRSLRKLDVSGTAIKELPSFLFHLERLRLLRIHGFRLLSLTRTFHSMELASLGLKELDLSACNLSVIPDGIGLLYSLKELDLSENNFVTLPTSISLLSNLRMLCLNSCTRLESLPLLSKINEVTVHGGEIRFSHYILGEGLDVSKFRMSSHRDNPSVSCLNCPKLIESQSGSGLADTILKKYLQVRTESRGIPEVIFEIVGAGSEIPDRVVKLGRSHLMILKDHDLWGANFDRCIGVALCAVIGVPHPLDNMSGAYIEVKYEVVAHIHVAGKYWRIPVPVNFLEAELETQLVWHWPVTDDFRRAVYLSQKNQFEISFSVEPKDGNLEVKKFWVRFLYSKDVWKLRGYGVSIHGIPSIVKMISLFRRQKLRMRWYKEVCEANQELQSLHLSFQDHTCKVINTLTSGFKHGSISLDSIREVIESLLEKNQEVVKVILECKKEILEDWTLLYFVRHFFKMSTRMLELCTNFLESIDDRRLIIVQVAMQQIEAKRRAGTLNFSEMMQHLIDLEAPMVPLSADFRQLFDYISAGQWDYAVQKIHDTKSPSVTACKVSLVTTAATLSTVLISAVVALRSALSPTVRGTMNFVHGMRTLFDEWLAGYEYKSWDEGYGSFSEMDEDFEYETSMGSYFKYGLRITDFKYSLRITDFDRILELLEELRSNMEWALEFSDFVTKQDEEEIVILMDEIKMRISGFTNTIEHMSKHAYKCIRYLRQAATALESNLEVESRNTEKKVKYY